MEKNQRTFGSKTMIQILLILLTAIFGCQSDSDKQDPESEPDFFSRLGVIESKKIGESSGVTLSRHLKDGFWTINDSDNGNEVFLLASNGELRGIVQLDGVANRDWEAISRFEKDKVAYLVVADVGDNQSKYKTCQLHIFPEPKMEGIGGPKQKDKPSSVNLSLKPITLEFRYADGARDCETLAIDPATLDIWLFEKISRLSSKQKPGVYRIKGEELSQRIEATRASEKQSSNNQAESVLTVDRASDFGHLFLTDGDFSPDGRYLIIRNYTNALLFERPEKQTWAEAFSKLKPTLIPLPLQRQAEAIAFTADSRAVITTSEFVGQPIWRIDIPAVLKQLNQSKDAKQ